METTKQPRLVITRKPPPVNCPKCKNGALFPIHLSRLEEGLGHFGYRCDNKLCSYGLKYIPSDA